MSSRLPAMTAATGPEIYVRRRATALGAVSEVLERRCLLRPPWISGGHGLTQVPLSDPARPFQSPRASSFGPS